MTINSYLRFESWSITLTSKVFKLYNTLGKRKEIKGAYSEAEAD